MTFSSLDFIFFLIVVLLVYWGLNRRLQNLFLLGASYFFYGFIHPWFVLLLVASTIIDFGCARMMVRSTKHRRTFLLVSVLSNVAILATFKYLGFFAANVTAALKLMGFNAVAPAINLILPVGLSFYTFQGISYAVDVYRRKIPACRSFAVYALFASFFPQLVAGPIERGGHLLPQLEKDRTLTFGHVVEGLTLIAWGFFQKLLIADNVALLANEVFSIDQIDFGLLWAGVFAFAIQIYADFSGYTDIARGCAKLLGVDLVRNFDHPYLSKSPAEFWRRWHISLSSWIRDYLYIPLGGSRTSAARYAFNVMFCFALCGLWHGASWNFLLWGLYHGLLILTFHAAGKFVPASVSELKWLAPFRVVLMFGLTNVGWLIFRERDLGYLVRYLKLTPFQAADVDPHVAKYFFLLTCVYAIPIVVHSMLSRVKVTARLPDFPAFAYYCGRMLFAFVCVALILVLRSPNPAEFIYFQF
jgi:alginate O-acetyltransferase complex protein AlgI